MPKFLRSKTSFNGGELRPRLYSRDDVSQYGNGARTLINAVLSSTGPVERRTGSQYISEIKTSSKQVRLVKFQFSADDAFILEFGEEYIRFYTDKGQVQDGGVPVEISSPYSETEVQDLQFTQFGDTLYIVHPSYAPRTLIRSSSISWTLSEFQTFPPPTEELGYTPTATTVTPGATTGFAINFTASSGLFLDSDVGRQIINKTDGESGRASITSVTSSTVAVCDIVEDFTDTNAIGAGDWKLDLSPIADITPSGVRVGSIVTITADTPGTTTAAATFRANDIGKYILVHGGVVEVLAINSSSSIECEVIKSLTSEDETGNWTIEEPTWSSTRGYPRAVGLFEQRLIFGGTTAEPQSVWMSEVGLFDGFGVGANDSDAIDVDIVSSEVNRIEWISSGRDLVIGTSGAETTILSSNTVLAPSTIQLRPRSYYGSNTQQISTAGSEILFVPKSRKSIRTFVYNFDIDGYKAEDLTVLSSHYLDDTTIREIAYAQDPETEIYAVLEDGSMIVGIFDREQKVIGWSKFTDATGAYEQVAVINDGNADQVWTVIKRTINGATKRYIEVFDDGAGLSSTDGFSDSFLTYSGAETSTLTGLDHLEGETVQVKVNGAAHADKTVSSGEISLDLPATSATVGLQYTTTIETLDENLEVGGGSFLGQAVRWVEPKLHVYRSAIPTVSGQTLPARDSSMEMDQAVDLFSGFLEYGSVNSPRLTITTSTPFPLVLTGIFGIVEGSV